MGDRQAEMISIDEAIAALKSGRVVALPTETVYGLAASLFADEAIKQIFTLKGRPSNNPLIIHISSLDQLFSLCAPLQKAIKEDVELLAKNFWPGPLSLVLPANADKVPTIARANLKTVAFRMPKLEITQKIIEEAGPLVMPSANLSGKPSATEASHVAEDFGKEFPIVDGGLCQKGLESTVLYCDDGKWCIIREGSMPKEAFLTVLGYLPEIASKKKNQQEPLCPGQLFKHYSPKAKLTLYEHIPDDYNGCLLGFENRHYPKGCNVRSFGNLSQPETIAENLYRVLRQLDQDGIVSAAVDFDLPTDGLFSTLRERLMRASQ